MYSSRTFHDASVQETALPGWQQRYTQLSSGRFEGTVALLQLGDMMVMRERINVSIEQRYLPPENSLTLFSHAPTSGGFHVHGAYYPSPTIGFDCSRSEALIVTRPHADMMLLVVDKDVHAQDVEDTIGIFRTQGMKRAQDLFAWLGSLLEMCGSIGSSLPEDVLLLLPDLIKDRLTLLLDEAQGEPDSRDGQERHIYVQCMDWLEAHPNMPATISQLSHALGVPHQRLRRACLHVTGHGLDSILMLHRLNGAHRALLAARESRCKVSDVALDWGFLHWGRFSVRYHELFGEVPSQTLRAG